MKRWRFLMPRIAGLIALGLVGVLLYADLLSIHQIYRITPAMIDRAADAETRQRLIGDREVRDRVEQREKMAVGVVLAIDVLLFVWVGVSILRGPRYRSTQQELRTEN
jgi:hypothetical protein